MKQLTHKLSYRKLLLALTALGLSLGSANAAVILAMDGGGPATSTTSNTTVFDFSTAGDDIGSITGSFLASENANFASTSMFNNSEFSFNGTGAKSATWTISNLTPGSQWQVYTTWVLAASINRTTVAPYSINGSSLTVNQKLDPANDLVLVDPANSSNVNFQAIGATVTVDGTGVITVRQDSMNTGVGTDWVVIDGVALVQVAVPEPSASAALLGGLGLLALLRRRR